MPSALESAKEKAKADAARAMEERMAARAAQIKSKSPPAKKSPAANGSRARRTSAPAPPPAPAPEPMDMAESEEEEEDEEEEEQEEERKPLPIRGKRPRNKKATASPVKKAAAPAKKPRAAPAAAHTGVPTPPPSITPPSIGTSPYVADEDYVDPRFNPPTPPTPPPQAAPAYNPGNSWIPISSIPTIPRWLLPYPSSSSSGSPSRPPPPPPPARPYSPPPPSRYSPPPTSPKRVAFRDNRLEEVIPSTKVPPRPPAARQPPAHSALRSRPSSSPAPADRGPLIPPPASYTATKEEQQYKDEKQEQENASYYHHQHHDASEEKKGWLPVWVCVVAVAALAAVLMGSGVGVVESFFEDLSTAYIQWKEPVPCGPTEIRVWGKCVLNTREKKSVRDTLEKAAVQAFCETCRVFGDPPLTETALPVTDKQVQYVQGWGDDRVTIHSPTLVAWNEDQMTKLLWRRWAFPCLFFKFLCDSVRDVENFVRDNVFLASCVLLVILVFCAIAFSIWSKKRTRRQVRQLQSIVMDMLVEAEDAPPGHIRDEIMDHLEGKYRYLGLGRKGLKAIWKRVEKAVEEDNRVLVVPLEHYGRTQKHWRWTGLRRRHKAATGPRQGTNPSPARAVVS